jgi:hypothetical protein
MMVFDLNKRDQHYEFISQGKMTSVSCKHGINSVEDNEKESPFCLWMGW